MSKNDTTTRVRRLIQQAREGDKAAIGELLDAYRAWLHLLAQRELGSVIDARVGASDVVQQTLLSACANIGQFEGSEERELIGWLQRMVENNARDAIRAHVGARKRTVDREEPFKAHALRDIRETSPSQRAIRGEEAVQLARAMEYLTDDQREAVRLRYLEGWSIDQIAEQMDRSAYAIGGLLQRGMGNLRKHLHDS